MEIMNYELLEEMGIYIQKSKTFLWPLINTKIQPIETYLKFGNIVQGSETRLLIALFYNKDEDYLKIKDALEDSKYHDFTFKDDEFDIITFNMYSMKDDYDKITSGHYSEISEEYKLFISVIEKNKMVLKCLNPKNNYKEIASILGVYENQLEGKELLSPPSYDQETIYVTASVKKDIIDAYGFS